jgi:phytoene dehydrogenase-like protein
VDSPTVSLNRTILELVEARHLPEDFRAQVAAAEPACSAFAVHLSVDFVPDVNPAVHVSRDPVIGIAILSRVDPSAAPQNHSTMTILTLLPHAEAQRWFPAEGGDEWQEWRRSQDYEDRKKALGDRLVAAAETVIPDLSSHIVSRTDASPVTDARYDWASAGSIDGISREGRFKGAKRPVPGLVLAGSATHGAGIEAVLISGALCG